MRWVLRILLVLCMACVPFVATSKPIFEIATELGPEFDSNATRLAEHEEGHVASFLMRLMTHGDLRLPISDEHRLWLQIGTGGKLFFADEGQPANEFVQHGSFGWFWQLQPSSILFFTGNYYDAFQRVSMRDFRIGTGLMGIGFDHKPSKLRTKLKLGYQGLQYKPWDDYNFHSALALAEITKKFTTKSKGVSTDWIVTASYQFAFRDYEGSVWLFDESCNMSASADCYFYGEDLRRDFNNSFRLEAQYQGDVMASLWYSAELNWSNSFGETFVRHVIGLKFTAHTILGIYLTTKGVMQFSDFSEPYASGVSSQTFVNIDDENRSSFMIHLARDIFENWTLILRYSVFMNESSLSSENLANVNVNLMDWGFLRHLIFLGLRFEYDNNNG